MPSVTQRRHNRGFERVGPDSLGGGALPARRERDLRLGQAWREVVGEPLAERARVRRVARGVLEIEIDDARWADAIAPALAGLAARLAAGHPELSIRRYRVRIGDSGATPPARPLGVPGDLPSDSGPAGSDPRPARHDTRSARPPALEELAERYLRRRR